MKKTFWMLVGIICGIHASGQNAPNPVRLAILPETAEAQPAADVLTAELSKNNQVQLLERAEIERVYREQGLSAGGKDYLKLGQVLGADGVLAIQSASEGANMYLTLQLVAVKPGVILSDEHFGLPTEDVSNWAKNVLHRLTPLLPKLSVLPQDAVPISLVNFHAGLRTPESAELERQIFFLTVERLVREKRLFVLERKRMQSLSEEKYLANKEAEPFWNGKYLLEGAIDRDGFNPDVVTINARLIPPGGSPILIEAKGSRTNCTEVVNQFAEKVMTALKMDARPEAWNTADEADRFFKEAQWYLAWKIFPQARQSAEAAWALGKHDADCMNLRVRAFMPPPDAGIVLLPPPETPNPDKIDNAIQAARLYQELSRNLSADEPKPDTDWFNLGLENLSIATRVLQLFNCSPNFYMPVSDKLAELRAQARAMAELLSRAPSVHDSYFIGSRKITYEDLDHFEGGSSIYGLKIEGGYLWQDKPEDTLALYRELMTSPVFRYLHSRFWFRNGYLSTRLTPPSTSPSRLVAWNNADQKRLPDLWQRFVTELKESPDVSLQMEARALRLADTDNIDRFYDMFSAAGNPDVYGAAHKKYDEELSSAFVDFFDAFVTNRIYSKNWGVDTLVEGMGGDYVMDTKEKLKSQYQTEYAAKLAATDKELYNLEAFAKQIKFLQDNQPYDPNSFVRVFILGFKDYSREQALEIKPLLAEYKKGLAGGWARIGEMQVGQAEANAERILNPPAVAPPSPNRVAMTNGNPAQPPGGNFAPGRQPGTPSQAPPSRFPPGREAVTVAETPAPEPLVSSNIITVRDFYPFPLDGLPADNLSEFKLADHQMIENRLVLDFEFAVHMTSSTTIGRNVYVDNYKTNYAGVALFDPTSGNWQVAAPEPIIVDNEIWNGGAAPETTYIENRNLLLHHTTIWRGTLYSSNGGKVQKFNWQGNRWDTNALPVSGNCQFYNLDGKLYVADNNSIQLITDDARGTKLLASIQRQPPVTSLDSQGALMDLALFTDAQKNLCAAVHNRIFRWDGNDWHEIGAAATWFMPAVFDDGVLFSTDGFNLTPARITRFEMQSNSVELCLSQIDQEPWRRGNEPRRTDANAAAKPLWKLPKELSLPNFTAALWQSNLFLMTDHSEKFRPKDGYDSALFCFLREQAPAGKILLKFDSSESCPPTAGLGSNSQPLMHQIGITRSWMLFTPKFLLCGRERWGDVPDISESAGFKPGIWVVPLTSITTELSTLRELQRQKKGAETNANLYPATRKSES